MKLSSNNAETMESLRNERNQYRILVDITNSVLAHLDMDGLISEVSKEIHRFVGINHISLMLCRTLSSNSHEEVLYSSRYQVGKSVIRHQYKFSSENTKAEEIINQNQSVLIEINNEDQNDVLIKRLIKQNMQTALLLPLAFNHKPLGLLILAHEEGTIFTDDTCHLLQQIAARIGIAIENAAAYEEITHLKDNLKNENIWLNEQIDKNTGFSEIVYQSEAMSSVLEQISLVAQSDSTVLILGETGTGKELIARAIHQLSQRNNKSMIKMNCAAVPSGLLESDLFGHDKGAFTGATNTHIGRFEMANKSTLFLDEIGDMPIDLQPKLLRVLQEREIERLGGNKVIPVDVRLIAATNKDLHQLTDEGDFREDLYYRLNVFPIIIPPLRERPEDIILLAKYFTQKIAQRMERKITCIPADALAQLTHYPWPGNVRELENIIERAVILTRGSTLNLQLKELHINKPSRLKQVFSQPSALEKKMQTVAPESDNEERERIIQALRETNGVVAGTRGAALKLGLKRTTLLSRMQRLGISIPEIL